MARKVFFSFHYQKDIFRVNVVRNSHIVEGTSAAGFHDASLWEEAKLKGDKAVKDLIDRGLEGTSVTCVLIGQDTAQRRWVTYEIERSVQRGNGLLGIHLANIRNITQLTTAKGAVPEALVRAGARVYDWDKSRFGEWVEAAYRSTNFKM